MLELRNAVEMLVNVGGNIMYDQLYNWMRNTFYPAYQDDMADIKSIMSSINTFLSNIDRYIFYIALTGILAFLLYLAYKSFKMAFYRS